jgi:hypothetical protein
MQTSPDDRRAKRDYNTAVCALRVPDTEVVVVATRTITETIALEYGL